MSVCSWDTPWGSLPWDGCSVRDFVPPRPITTPSQLTLGIESWHRARVAFEKPVDSGPHPVRRATPLAQTPREEPGPLCLESIWPVDSHTTRGQYLFVEPGQNLPLKVLLRDRGVEVWY